MNYSQAIQNIADTITAQIHNMIKSKSYSDKTFTAKSNRDCKYIKMSGPVLWKHIYCIYYYTS